VDLSLVRSSILGGNDMASSMLSPYSSASSSFSTVLTSSAIKLPPLTWKLRKVESIIVPSSSASSFSSSMYSLPCAMKEKGHDYSVVKNNIDEEEQSISEHNERDERREVERKVLQERELQLTFTLDYLCKRLRRDVHVPIPPGREKVPKIRALLLGSSSIKDELA
ncbi:hypothetical protein QOT17_013259, partial [Balamuthia mandrillaris]